METPKRRCLACGAAENLTKDHVVARFILRTTLTREQYEDFSRIAGKKWNSQKLCGECNSRKGYGVVDYRGPETANYLMELLRDRYGVSIEIEVVMVDDPDE